MEKHQVQWAAQFAVGAELMRRGYSCAFFLGNQPSYDLLCTGKQDFHLQIKGFSWDKPKKPSSKGNYVIIKDLFTGEEQDLIVIVRVPKHPEAFEFYIAKRKDMADAENVKPDAINPKSGKPYAKFSAGISYRNFEKFKDCWNVLPPPHL